MPDELPLQESPRPETIWFAPRCCVVTGPGRREVYAGGVFLGAFGREDVAQRNVLLVTLAQQQDVHLGELSRAFGLAPDSVRLLRRLYEEHGLEPLIRRKRGGSTSSVSPRTVRRLEEMFERGLSVGAAFDEVGAAAGSRPTVGRIRKAWADKKLAAAAGKAGEAEAEAEGEAVAETVAPRSSEAEPPVGASVPPDDDGESEATLKTRAPSSVDHVQHVGTWLLIAAVNRLGLHARAAAIAGVRVKSDALRLALDATIAALALGERCVEGVRRLATVSGAALLLATRAPSTTWTRRTLGRFATHLGGPLLQQSMAAEYLSRAKADAGREGPAFYVDNHLRPYTGKQVLRRGWRMQDKRVRPGASDYYVHDEDGRIIRHVVAPAHGALTDFLSPICEHLRLALGPEETILVAFDRAGSFPEQMAELRDDAFEFVTYERRPYALLSERAFTDEVVIRGEKLLLHESRANLGAGRGRVRRISVRGPDGYQVNLLAVSKRRSAGRLVELLFGRWIQENGFKHADERWGINQLDGRTVQPYPEDALVPNPARRRLENALQLARVREGLARNELARLPEGSDRREEVAAEVKEAADEQRQLQQLRPSTPTHALLKETELSGKLVHHDVNYKLTIDTLRAACLNAEADLALALAPHLPKPAEAKKVLANLFAAPGRVQVFAKTIVVTLAPAATTPERNAVDHFFAVFNRAGLRLPGDQKSRRLRFIQAEHQ